MNFERMWMLAKRDLMRVADNKDTCVVRGQDVYPSEAKVALMVLAQIEMEEYFGEGADE